jgi:hypothetical protein
MRLAGAVLRECLCPRPAYSAARRPKPGSRRRRSGRTGTSASSLGEDADDPEPHGVKVAPPGWQLQGHGELGLRASLTRAHFRLSQARVQCNRSYSAGSLDVAR